MTPALTPQRVTLVTLGVADLAAARAFYARLGWAEHKESQPGVAFFQINGLALAHQVRATSTAARVQALVGLGALSPGEGEDLAEALHVFMALKLKAGLAEQEQARPVSGTVVVQQLSSLDRDLLKDALGVVKRFQQLLRTRFHLGAL